jgi:hypothetical protein
VPTKPIPPSSTLNTAFFLSSRLAAQGVGGEEEGSCTDNEYMNQFPGALKTEGRKPLVLTGNYGTGSQHGHGLLNCQNH